MQFQDQLYGTVKIAEPVLCDLMRSGAMQRIRGVSQHGITALLGITAPFSRFDHSVGVMLLTRKLGAGLPEQIAALLHDISHTAFSHVIDFVFDDGGGQSYHEEQKMAFVARSDIPAVLEGHGLDWRAFMDERQFSLLEQPLPALCADRLDYFLRDLEFLQLARSGDITEVLESLSVVDRQIVVNDPDIARWLAYTFIEVDRASWSNFREVGLYQVTAEAIKTARQHKVIDEADIWGVDQTLWQKLQATDCPEVAHWVRLIAPGTRFFWSESQSAFRVSAKVRSIDPPVSVGQSIVRLTELDPTFARYRQQYLADKQGPWPMGIVAPSSRI